MSHNVRDEDRFYAVFQPSAFSQGIEPYYPLQPELWKSPVYGQRVPWLEPYQGFFDNEEDTPEERIGERAGGIAGLVAGLAANANVPWLKERFILSRVLFVMATAGLGRELGKYIGSKVSSE